MSSIQHLWTQTELTIGGACGIAVAFLNHILGGIDASIEALALLITIDIITGLAAGMKYHRLSSAIGVRGLFKKSGILLCILIAALLDTAMSIDLFRDLTIAGFAVIEALSLMENIDRLGYGYIIPHFLRDKIKQIAEEKKLIEKKKGNKQ